MDKLILYHRLCMDSTKVIDLIDLEITPTYNQVFLVSGGKKEDVELHYCFYEECEEESIE